MTASSQIFFALRAASPKYTPKIRPTFGWLLRLAIQQSHRNPRPHRPLYFLFSFFSSLHSPPETMGKHPPPRVPPVRIASPVPPLPPTPSIGWLSCHPFKWRPPKTGASPVSQLFHGRHFGAHNKGTKRSARKPGHRAPLIGSLGAAAPRFGSMSDVAMEIDG